MQTRRVVYIDDDTWDQLGKLADQRQRSYSRVVRDLVREETTRASSSLGTQTTKAMLPAVTERRTSTHEILSKIAKQSK